MSEDKTNPMPADLLNQILAELREVKQRLTVVEERLLPTNQLPKVLAAVNDLNRKFDAFMRSDFDEFKRRQGYDEQRLYDMEQRLNNIEDQLKPKQ